MQLEFFASSNSSEGFKSYYPEVFARANRLYVIKGGPGTGKSSLMRRAAAAAEKKGFATEHYFCSSDPSSLDGVLKQFHSLSKRGLSSLFARPCSQCQRDREEQIALSPVTAHFYTLCPAV